MTIDPQTLSLNTRQVLIKRLSTTQSLAYTGPMGELVIDTTLKLLRIQDGSTPGGILITSADYLATQVDNVQSQINSILNNIDPTALDSLSEIVANVNALIANNVESQLVNSGFYANLTATGNLILDGSLLPKNHEAQDLGSPTRAWRDLYISNATAYFGNASLTVTDNGLQVFNSANQAISLIGNVKFPDGTTQSTAVNQSMVANIFYLLTPNVSASLVTIHTDVTNAISYFGNLANAAVTTVQANLQAQIDYIKTNIDPAALDSLTEIVASFQNIDADVISNISTLGDTVANLVVTENKLVSGNAEVILNTSGPEPYVLFPAASTGGQLQISEAEISSIAGNLALTSAQDAFIISNGDGTIPGGSRLWRFDKTGGITLPNNAIIKDSTTNSISFGLRAGDSGQGTLTVAIGSQAGEINQGLQSTAVGSGAGNYNQGIGTVAIGTNAGAFNQGLRAVAIGGLAGSQNQGEYAVALGNFAGGTDQPNNSIIINASGTALNGSASGLFIDPVREVVGTKIVYYNSSTKEITTGPIGLTSNSNVSITSNNNVWTFGTDGGLRTPDNQLTIGSYTIQASNNNEIDLSNGPDVTIKSNVGGVTITSNWAVNPAEWGFLPDGNLELPNGTRIRDIGSIGSASGLELGNHGFQINFGSTINDWAIFSGARLIQFDPGEIFNISFGEQGWQFANTGNITFPDGTIQSTAWTGSGGSASTVDITNTNGLTTTYYPTFVESRTSGQYMRADVDLTYRTDDNLLRSGNIQVGRNIYGSYLGGISDAIQLRPNIDVDKRFLFTVDSGGGNYIRSGMEMPMAEVDKAVTLAFPHDNSTAGYIFNQGTDTNGTEWNDALVIFQNGGNVKIGTITGVNGNKVWEFNQTGNLTLPQTNMNASPAPVSLPGITFTDGTRQTTAFTGTPTELTPFVRSRVIISGGSFSAYGITIAMTGSNPYTITAAVSATVGGQTVISSPNHTGGIGTNPTSIFTITAVGQSCTAIISDVNTFAMYRVTVQNMIVNDPMYETTMVAIEQLRSTAYGSGEPI